MSKRVNNYELMDNPNENNQLCNDFMKISSISTGFVDLPGKTTLNIFVQGCKLHCNGCQNTDLLSFDGGSVVFLSDIEETLKKRTLSTWICWLGGDATYQPDGFKEFNKFFKSKNYGVCLYTGRYFSEVRDLLDDVDVIIDGPWEGVSVTDETSNQGVRFKRGNVWFETTWNKLKGKIEEI